MSPRSGTAQWLILTMERAFGVFDLSMAELRDAVHHAGHQVEEVERYLRQKKAKPH